MIMQDIVKASSFQYIIVITTLCPAMHNIIQGFNDELSVLDHLEESILGWMGNMVTQLIIYNFFPVS